MGWRRVSDIYFFFKHVSDLKKIFYEVMRLDYIITMIASTYTAHIDLYNLF